jgi:hypothetical protein
MGLRFFVLLVNGWIFEYPTHAIYVFISYAKTGSGGPASGAITFVMWECAKNAIVHTYIYMNTKTAGEFLNYVNAQYHTLYCAYEPQSHSYMVKKS